MTQDKEKKFKLDIKETLIRNFLWIPMFVLVVIFSFLGLSQVTLFEGEGFKLMFLIFCLFFVLKLFSWVGHPIIVMEETR